MNEKWRDIKGFEGIYQVSSFGKIKSFKQHKGGYVLSIKNKKRGYLNVVLHKGKKFKSIKVHRLVAETFIPNPENKLEVNHKDGNKQNNHVNNLEWVTPKENIADAMKRTPQMVAGMNHYNRYVRPKIIQQFTLSNQFIAEYPNAKEAENTTGVCSRNILQVASRDEYQPGKTRKQAGGFVWRYKQNDKVAI